MAVRVKPLTPSRQRFAEAAKYCKAKVAHLPRGAKLQAYRQCIKEYMRAR